MATHDQPKSSGSHSDNDLSYNPITPRPAPSACSTNSTPPSNISRPSQVPTDTKERLRVASPDGYRCVVTRDIYPLDCCHVLRRSTRSDPVKHLEYVWGMPPGTLNLDTRYNLVFLRPDLHRTFDSGDWALVPPMRLLEEIVASVAVQNVKTTRTIYISLFPNAIRSYTFTHLRRGPQRIIRSTSDPTEFEAYHPPFDTFPPIDSHIHPYFAICDVALKDNKHRPNSEPTSEYSGMESELERRVTLCRAIYQLWLDLKPPVPSTPELLALPRSHSTHDTRSRRSDLLSDSSAAPGQSDRAKRRHGSQRANSTGAVDDGGVSKRQRAVSNSTGTDPLFTPDASHGDEDEPAVSGDHDETVRRSYVPYPSNIRNWVKGVEPPTCSFHSTMAGSVAGALLACPSCEGCGMGDDHRLKLGA